jgi:hypothetical protein
MECDGESEMQPVDDFGGHARSPAAGEGRMTDERGARGQVRRLNKGKSDTNIRIGKRRIRTPLTILALPVTSITRRSQPAT